MRSRKALGGRRTIVLLALGLVAALLGPADRASAEPIDDPMTGILPPCPAQLHESVSDPSVWVEPDGTDPFDANHEAGLEQNCAWQNMQDRTDTSLWPRAANFRASPNTVPINDSPTTIRFLANGMTSPGPFNAPLPDCMPLSTRASGCADNTEDPTPYVAYRLANGAGQFVGPWTLVSEPSDNPYFDLTRDTFGCADRYPNWTPNYPHTGLPCEYELNFATNVSGAPVLTRAAQVVVGIRWLYGTKTVGSNTGYEYGYTAMVPMLFTPGTSSSITLDPLPSPVAPGTATTLRATTVGPPAGTEITFYRRAGNGVESVVGQALTDSGGVATFGTTSTASATYWAQLPSGQKSQERSQVVTPPTPPSIALDALASPVAHGTATTLRATVVGPPAGTPVTFYRRSGSGAVGAVGQALTDGAGVATLGTSATGSATYWAQLPSGQASAEQAQAVTRSVAITAKKKGKRKYEFTATAAVAGGSLLLQRKDAEQGWVTVKTGAAVAGAVVWKLKPPKGKSLWRAVLPGTPDFLEAVSGEVKAKVKPKKKSND